jgi:integrase/recombinase XerD
MPTTSIRMMAGEENQVMVSMSYSPQRVAKMKTIAGRRWHPGEKCWTVPSSEGTIAALRFLFAGEAMEIDRALGSPSAQDRLNLPRDRPPAPILALLDGVHQAVRKRHYSEKTDKAYVRWITRFLRFHGKI